MSTAQEDLASLIQEAEGAISAAEDVRALDQCRVQYLGKKGKLTGLLKTVSGLSAAEKPVMGKAVNQAKQQLQQSIASRESILQAEYLASKIQSERLDITLPGKTFSLGSLHPVTKVTRRVKALFASMGFQVAEGPEIEDEYHNFEALNIPSHHPARNAVDTFYFGDGALLRTHTSPVQIRTMETQGTPLRIITPGRVYRRDSDHTHTPMFHQLEGLFVDEACTFADLKGILQRFFDQFFESSLVLRFRPSFFPFTEPSAEVDIQHQLCQGKGCRTCGYSGWLEVLGCGMVHPSVLEKVNIDTSRYTGFAFGLGLDRLAMLRYGIDDLRLFFDNDIQFLEQF